MTFEIIIFREHPRTDQLLLQDIYKIQQIFRILVSNIIYSIRRNRQTVFPCFSFRSTLHDSLDTFYDIIYIGEISFAIAVVEDLNRLTF